MAVSNPDSNLVTASHALLSYYCDELPGQTKTEILDQWLHTYPADWVRSALIEALYQGRYKLISVTHLLAAWKRRGEPLSHFSYEFATMVSHNFPRSLAAEPLSRRRPGRWQPRETASSSAVDLQLPASATGASSLTGLASTLQPSLSGDSLEAAQENLTIPEPSAPYAWPSFAAPGDRPSDQEASRSASWDLSVPWEMVTPASQPLPVPSSPAAQLAPLGGTDMTEEAQAVDLSLSGSTAQPSTAEDSGSEPIHPIHEYIPEEPSGFYDRLTAIAHSHSQAVLSR